MQYDRQITISTAGSRRATYWPPSKLYWSELITKLQTPTRSTESLQEYLAMPKSKQDDLKDVGGYVGGTLKANRRKAQNVIGRDLITLDLDNIAAGQTADVLRRLDGLGCAYVTYSTRKHYEAKPRLRVLLPLNRAAGPDEYEPLARRMAAIIGIEMADPSTFEASRLMYWPSCCADSRYVFDYRDKAFLDADGLLATYANWRDITSWPEVPGVQQTHQRLAAKQGDPLTKAGVVGAFCKTYDVYRAMETFLPGVYAPCDDMADRYTFTGGSTTGGAIVYDHGAFLYSHHSTDPAGGRLVNSFDLVRLHLYGEKDDEAKPETPTNKLPSFMAMCELAVADNQVAAVLLQERYDKATQDFATAPADDPNWILKLAKSSQGQILKTVDNVLIIMENDPLLRSKLAFDEFANRGLVLGPLPWDGATERRQWTDVDDAGLLWYMEKTYGINTERRIFSATALVAHKHTINDVRQYLTSLAWDGLHRLDTLFIDYLGAMDTPYVRASARKSFTAAVARVMAPGVKYDFMPILAGPQGIGKSTLLRLLGRRWYSDSLQTFEGKEASEMLQGTWINEIGELNGLSKSETNAVKQFLSRTEDIYREPYGRRTGVYPRRCVFFGTTNDNEFLRDRTGNRRFWPIDVGLQLPSKDVFTQLENEVDQIWAEAFCYWQLGEPLYLSGEVEKEAMAAQETHRESGVREGLIHEFLERPIPADWDARSISERLMYWSGDFGRVDITGGLGETRPRYRVCAAEIWVECLKGDLKYMKQIDVREINGIIESTPGWYKSQNGIRFGRAYGLQRGYIKII